MTMQDVRPGMVFVGRDDEPILVRSRDPYHWALHFSGWNLRTGKQTDVYTSFGGHAEVIDLPIRVALLVDRREGLVQLWDDVAGEMLELPEDRLGVGERCLEPGRPFVVRLYNGRPVWVVGPADAG